MLLETSTLPSLARGAAILGAGGGGDSHLGLLIARQAIERHGPVELLDLDDLDPQALVMPCGLTGAPAVLIEKLCRGDEIVTLRRKVEEHWGRPVTGLLPAEIGGANGLVPIAWAALTGLPVVDADGIGRAFPEYHQSTMHIHGISPNPFVMCDERGNVLVIEASADAWVERLSRSAVVEFGANAACAGYQMTGEQAQRATVRGSVSLAWRIGEALRAGGADAVDALPDELHARQLVQGKIGDVHREITGGFVRGFATIDGLGSDEGRLIRVELQNEFLVALEDGMVLASVPDLITVMDSESHEAISSERLRYGQRITLVAMRAHSDWHTERGLEIAGPRAFGYDFDYVAA